MGQLRQLFAMAALMAFSRCTAAQMLDFPSGQASLQPSASTFSKKARERITSARLVFRCTGTYSVGQLDNLLS
jgi:hypothetical protein